MWFKQKRITVVQKKGVRIIAFWPYIFHSTSAFEELQILMLKDLHYIQLYKIYCKNVNNLLPAYFQRFTSSYNDDTDHYHDLRYNVLRLPMTRKEYYVQCTKYQFLKLIRETSQLDLDRCLTFSITQFIGYFGYKIMDAYNSVCNITNCFVCAGSLPIEYINSQHNVLYYGLVKNIVYVTSCYEFEMNDEHTASGSL